MTTRRRIDGIGLTFSLDQRLTSGALVRAIEAWASGTIGTDGAAIHRRGGARLYWESPQVIAER